MKNTKTIEVGDLIHMDGKAYRIVRKSDECNEIWYRDSRGILRQSTLPLVRKRMSALAPTKVDRLESASERLGMFLRGEIGISMN